MFNSYTQYTNIMPILAPIDMVTTARNTVYMDLKYAHEAAFLVFFGAITSTTTTDAIVVTVQAASAVDATEVAIAFNYRKSGEAASANTWGAKTAATTTGVSVNSNTEDNIMVWIELDPAAIQAEVANARYVRVVLTDTPDIETALVSVIGFMDTSYKQTTYLSATAAASA